MQNPNGFLYKKPTNRVAPPAEIQQQFEQRFGRGDKTEAPTVSTEKTAWDSDINVPKTQGVSTPTQNTTDITTAPENTQLETPVSTDIIPTQTTPVTTPVPAAVGQDFLSTQAPQDIAQLVVDNKIKTSDLQQLQQTDPLKYQEITATVQKKRAEAQYNMTAEDYKKSMDSYVTGLQNISVPSADDMQGKYNEYVNTPQYAQMTGQLGSVVGKVNTLNDQLEYLVDDIIDKNQGSSGLLISALTNKSRKELVRERNGLINEATLLQSQIEQHLSQAQQQFSVYQQSIQDKRNFDVNMLATKYGIDGQKAQLDFQMLDKTISQADSVLSSIGEMKASEAEFAREMAKEDLKFEREMYKSQVEADRGFSYDKILKSMDIESQFALKDYDTQSKLAILRQEYSLKQQYPDVKSVTTEDSEGNKVVVWSDNQGNIVNMLSSKDIGSLSGVKDFTGATVSDTIMSGGIDSLSAMIDKGKEYSCGDRGQCGQWYNDAIGGKNGTWVGDTYASKQQFVDSTITEGKKGMGVVFNPGGEFQKYGHIGVLASGLYEKNGKMGYDVISANYKGNEKLTKDFIQANTIDISNGGFIPTNIQGDKSTKISLSDVQIYNNTTFKPQDLKKGSLEYDKWSKYTEDKYKALNNTSTDIDTITYLSAGGKEPTQSQGEALQKYEIVVSQVGNLTTLIKDKNTGPIADMFNTPYSVNAKAIQAQLQAIVPGLARGVYMEVGVLTDQDIENYKKTLPNLKNTEEVNKAVLAMTLDSLAEGYKIKLSGLAKGGTDVSLYAGTYKSIVDQADQYKRELGIGSDQINSKTGTGSALYQLGSSGVSVGGTKTFDIDSLLNN